MLAQTTMQQTELKVQKDLSEIGQFLQEKQTHANRQAHPTCHELLLATW